MENKLNQLAIEQYAEKYSEILLKKIFSERKNISGKEIMREIPVQQVALFVLFNLFKRWKDEMLHLKSPYFNYEDEEVQKKLEEFMNLLSKHISVEEEPFALLLTQAVKDSLLLIISPLKFYENLVDTFNGSAPNMDEEKGLQRFIKINTHMRDALLTAWAANYSSEELFDKAFEGLTTAPQEVKPLIEPFNKLLPVELSDFIEESDVVKEEADVNSTSEVIIKDEIIEEEEQVQFQTIHTQYSEESTSILADSLGFEADQSSLKTMLTINQKFMFVNDLFDGNTEDFNKVLDFLDSCETKEVVLKFINSNYIQRGNWKAGAPQVKEFLALIDKKFV
ncbi:MAG: hypothetical protein L3J29_09625 [Cyclobacteriaceae bacterium]|nr:hypothetical protein [Cyclobacteriaceae bacterium]